MPARQELAPAVAVLVPTRSALLDREVAGGRLRIGFTAVHTKGVNHRMPDFVELRRANGRPP
jgi:hypothetical protein